MTEPRLRDLTEADLGWLASAEDDMFGAGAWSEALIREDFRWGSNRYRGVEIDGELVAYAIYGFEGDAFHLLNIAVVPQHRRAGLGKLLFEEFLKEAQRLGAADVWLEVAVDNDAALELYRAYGFEQVRVRRRYYQPGDIDALVMRKVIRPFAPQPPPAPASDV